MKKYYIVEGDKTTVGGIVQRHTGSGSTTSWHGRVVSNIGDQVACPACQSIGIIVAAVPRRGIDNKNNDPALDGDICVCKCSPPPKLINSQTVFFEEVDDIPSVAGSFTHINQPLQPQQNLTNSLVDDKKEPCPPECVVDTVIFNTNLGNYIISKEAWKFILSFEGFEPIPYVPKNSDSSGVTLGYGYDLGQQSATQIQKDLTPYYTSEQIKRLIDIAQGKKGENARKVLPKIIDIKISKEAASKMVIEVKHRYAQQVVDIYPEVLSLHPHCQGMLLDLIYNRGNGLNDRKGQLTRIHMRQIRDAFKEKNPEKIPDILRDMSKLWASKGLQGLVDRRKSEATWFEKGLKCDCYQ